MAARPFDAEAVVIGGGMVGLTLGLALGASGIETVVIDAADPAQATDAGFDGRNSAIAYSSCRMYEALGAWTHLRPHAQPINDIVVSDGRVSEGAAPLFLSFESEEFGEGPLGHLIENRHIRLGLLAALDATPKARLEAPMGVAGVAADGAGVTVKLADGGALRAHVALACDGRGSPLREAAGISTVGWSYAQMGIVATVAHERPHEGVAQELFLPSGPFAILPMTGNRSSLVWTERADLARAYLALSETAFDQEIAKRFGSYLGPTRAVGPRWSYPLAFHLARSYVAERMALVGDAAHGVHPIAGQGLNMGLRDVAALTECLIDARRLGLDIGRAEPLERYQRWRRFDNASLALVTDALNRLFSNDFGPARLARDLGLGLVGRIGPLRRFFMRHAGGAVGDLPRLLRGEPA